MTNKISSMIIIDSASSDEWIFHDINFCQHIGFCPQIGDVKNFIV